MKRLISLFLLATLILAGCGAPAEPVTTAATTEAATTEAPTTEAPTTEAPTTPAEPISVKVMMPYGTPTLTMVKLLTDQPEIAEGVTVTYETVEAPDVLRTALINGEADIAIAPTNLAAVVYNKGLGYKLAGSGIWGTLYIASSEDISSLSDLRGKSITLMGRGLTPDAVLRYLLISEGLDPEKDVTLEYLSGTAEVAASYSSGKGTVAMLPEPVLTSVLMKRKDSKMVIDIQEAWSAAVGVDKFPQASIVVKESLIESHPEFVEAFLKAYDEGIQWVNDNPADAGVAYEALGIGLKAKLIEKAVPHCNLKFVPAAEGKEAVSAYLKVLFDFNPKLLGGKMIDEGFYFEK